MKRMINKFIYTGLIAGMVAMGTSCTTDDLDPTLAQEKESANAILTVEDMGIIVLGAYNRMTDDLYYGRDFIITNEVRTPNAFTNSNSGRFTTQATFQQLPNAGFIWSQAYAVIASANIVINTDVSTLSGTGGGDPNLELAQHLQGEAYAIRALAHFDLLKTYGQQFVGGDLGVPYVTEFLGEDQLPARGTISENKAAIYADLQTAFEMMSEEYFDSSRETINKYVAPGLESRVAVFFGDWARARDAAKMVIDSGNYSIVPAENFVQSFAIDGSVNSMFELAFSDVDNLGSNSLEFIYRGTTYGDISITDEAFLMYESDDDVRTDILGTEELRGEIQNRNFGKYPDRSSNVDVIRYEEVILNYAEALFELGEGDPLMWLNMIPEHRNANTYDTATKENILEERREEFAFEGLYYWDLLRTGQDIVRAGNLPITVPFGDLRLAYPIPFVELDANTNIEQNPQYPTN